MKKTAQERSSNEMKPRTTENDAEEVVVPSVAALVGILMTGLL